MTEYATGDSRDDHIHNICVALQEVYAEKQQFGIITSNGLLEFIAEKVGKTRAKTTHGDCLGGHGLGLNVYRKSINGKTERVFDLTEEVLQRCREWLDSEDGPDGGILL